MARRTEHEPTLNAMPEWRERRLVAASEVGRTRVTRRTATFATVALGVAMVLVPIVQMARGGVGAAVVAAGRGLLAAAAQLPHDPGAANAAAATSLEALEDTLAEQSPLVVGLLPATRLFAVRVLGVGSRDVVTGADGWLFWRPDLEAVLAPDPLVADGLERRRRDGITDPDPLVAIDQFRADLATRGIALVVVLAPTKPELRADRLGVDVTPTILVRSAGVASFATALASRGIALVDPTAALGGLLASGTDEVFLRTDSHWTPGAVVLAAQQVAAQVRSLMPGLASPQPRVERLSRLLVGDGDLVRLLRLPELSSGSAETAQVAVPTAARLERGGPVLLLGDSFAGIYSRPELGWGSGAGLGEQLAAELGVAVDVVTVNAGGAAGSRRRLVGEIAQDRDRLAGTRVVVWEIASRELVHGNWSVLPLALSPQPTE